MLLNERVLGCRIQSGSLPSRFCCLQPLQGKSAEKWKGLIVDRTPGMSSVMYPMCQKLVEWARYSGSGAHRSHNESILNSSEQLLRVLLRARTVFVRSGAGNRLYWDLYRCIVDADLMEPTFGRLASKFLL